MSGAVRRIPPPPIGGPGQGVRWNSEDALFVPDETLIATGTPIAVPLLHLMPPLLGPETPATYEHTVRFWSGTRGRVRVIGDPSLGVPNVSSYGTLYAVLWLAAQGNVTSEGQLLGVSYRDLAALQGYKGRGGSKLSVIKEDLIRWTVVRFETTFDLEVGQRLDAIESGLRPPALPNAELVADERTRYYEVLTHGRAKQTFRARGGTGETLERDMLEFIGVRQIWLDLMRAGMISWTDPALFGSLGMARAKLLYQHLLLRAVTSEWGLTAPWRPTHQELYALLDLPDRYDSRTVIRQVLEKLLDAGVLASAEMERVQRGVYRYTLLPGEQVVTWRQGRGVTAGDGVRARTLLWWLQQWPLRFSHEDARALVRQNAVGVHDLLRYVRYLVTERAGRLPSGEEPRTWKGWFRAAITAAWSIEDPGYEQWLARRVPAAIEAASDAPSPARRRLAAGADQGEIDLPHADAPAPAEPADARRDPTSLGAAEPASTDATASGPSDDPWTEIQRTFAVTNPLYRELLVGAALAALPTPERPVAVVSTPQAFAWVPPDRLVARLSEAFREVLGFDVQVTLDQGRQAAS